MKDFAIQWFPGHMTKAKRMMENQIKLVDAVVEVIDARIPRSSMNPLLLEIIGQKPRVIAMNKTDLADAAQTVLWKEHFKHKGLPVVEINSVTGKGMKELIAKIREAAKPVADKWAARGVRKYAVRIMIVGIPNAGKSTLINRLLGKNKTVTADRPGVTKGQQWLMMAEGLELLDTPGVLWPKFEQPAVGFALAITGAVRDEVFDVEQAVVLLLGVLRTNYPQALEQFYKLSPTGELTDAQVLKIIAELRGCLLKGGVIDTAKCARLVLKDFRTGRLGNFTLEKP